jgi:hypothetical protein
VSGFQCRLVSLSDSSSDTAGDSDSQGAGGGWEACKSPVIYRDLPDMRYVVQVRTCPELVPALGQVPAKFQVCFFYYMPGCYGLLLNAG